MTWLWRWAKRGAFVLCLCVIGLLAPVGYVEIACRGNGAPEPYAALIAPDHHRPETRTLMTYPEWHIVHAYQDYGEVIRTGDPHDYGYLKGISGFWGALCQLSKAAPAHGDIDSATKQMVYVIGVSFTAELLLKAAYEETLGKLFAALRGPERAPLDDISARQAADYARFLQQVPWYKWGFREDVAELNAHAAQSLRDTERRVALGLEFKAKAAYADVIAKAVAQVGPDELTLRMIAADLPDIAPYENVVAIGETSKGTELETPRYRELTHLMLQMAMDGAEFVEIAGNDDILFTALSARETHPQAIYSAPRQGFGDHRHLILVKVTDLARTLRKMHAAGVTVEHIHDY